MKRFLTVTLCIILLTSLLGGCANDADGYVPTGDGLTWDEDYTGPVYTHPNAAGEQELTLIYYPDRSMNPLTCADFTNRTLFSLLYQGLFTVSRDYETQPMLCRNYRLSVDMKTYTFYLEEATFGDGTPVTAADVTATLLAAKDSPYYSGRFLHISAVEAGADGSVVIRTDTPMENLPILLDIPILKAAEVQADYPMGSGPYVLDNAGGTPLLRRRTNWWSSAKVTATAPAIALKTAVDEPQIRDTFEFDSLDLVCADPCSDRYADYRCDYELWDCENGIFLYLMCNMDSHIFSIPEVRAALPLAIDRDAIVDREYRGFARSATLPASPSSPYYSQVLAERYAYDGTGETFKQAVFDAGLVGEPLILLVNSGDSLRLRIARTIAKTMTDAGFTVELKECNTEDYQWNLRNRNFDLCLAQTKLSANMDLSAFFDTYGSLSYGKINDAAMYALCQEALANQGNYYTLHQTVMNDGRLCPILFRSYAIYATRGLLTDLDPSRDNVFYYTTGRTMEQALLKEE